MLATFETTGLWLPFRGHRDAINEKGHPMGERKRASNQKAGFHGVTRKVLERLPLPGGDDQELAVVEVTYPPGGVAPLHRHPVGGIVYIVEGVAESAYGSDAPRQYRAGETLRRIGPTFHTLTSAIVTHNIHSAF
jgi:quercetin dioxygenase-like cupin family protein